MQKHLTDKGKKDLEFWKERYSESMEAIDKENSRKFKVVWISTFIFQYVISCMFFIAIGKQNTLTSILTALLYGLVPAIVLTGIQMIFYYSVHEYLHRDLCRNCRHINSVKDEIDKILNR